MLAACDLEKYAQHIQLKNIGKSGQLKLRNSKVLCVGLGGLGTPVCTYLVKAGIGEIGIIDGDVVELGNLPRQILYSENDVGKLKVDVCKEKLHQLNVDCNICCYSEFLTEDNALSIISDYDVVIDCSDNFATRYLVNDACCHLKKANISASVFEFNGMLSVFSVEGPCYRCLFEDISNKAMPNCSDSGVLNTFVGFLAVLQAHEAMKYILSIGPPSVGKVFVIDGLSLSIKQLTLNKNQKCEACSIKKDFSELSRPVFLSCTHSGAITYNEFLSIKNGCDDFLLIDIRDERDFKDYHLNSALNISVETVLDEMPIKNKMVRIILYCQTGKRSAFVREMLTKEGYANVFDIEGGVNNIRAIESAQH